MKLTKIEETELTEVINNIKNGKASGIDDIKSEQMKYIIKDEKMRKHTTKCFHNILKEKVNKDWLISLTTMIPKVKHPKILEHRPIAVTVNSSKIFWTIMREKIETHLENMNIVYENQYGFTKGGKPENCHFTLDYIANRNYTGNNRKKNIFCLYRLQKGL